MEKEFEVKANETVKKMIGLWEANVPMKNGTHKITVRLTEYNDKCWLTNELDSKEFEPKAEFSGSAHWFGFWLCFTSSKRQFYVYRATDENLVFGEADGAVIGNYKWQGMFTRVK